MKTIIYIFSLMFSFCLFFNYSHSYSQNSHINTEGLYNAEFIDNIFIGHFEDLENKNDNEFQIMFFDGYLKTYGEQCDAYLPKDKVKIMKQVCKTERVTTDYLGTETSRYCIEWKWEWTGLYARKDLYEAKMNLQNKFSDDALRSTLEKMTNPNAVGNSVDLMHKAKALNYDMSQILKLNPCDSKSLRRFEENLIAFSENREGIRMKEDSKYKKVKDLGGPTEKQNLTQLLNDLIYDQAKTWAVNKYVNNSISNISITSKDNKGRPSVITAYYNYSSFFGKSQGWARIVFDNGLPKCIYFHDYPNNCKTPKANIVNNYALNKYKI
ncbi:hypothetical protein [Flavobacterium sp. CS20]|uniref:hypothetical protein n=1 Tax=Flavobacterium sp. CS20 TaxID=2775246 RepID=UPI001B39FDB8|nr:hypothetical protein [Flavobacterium sp. CS20]QTY26062.1 hypothetical protein IGB25_08680 [Flavobacterium sp. CS20]